jgi:2-haloacid dehalogenase
VTPVPAEACVFDAYGTLLDLRSALAAQSSVLGQSADALLTLWRRKQLEYTWLRTLMGRHAGFETVTRDALRYALEAEGLADAELEAALLGGFRRLAAFPDAAPALAAIRRAGLRTAILSNGDPDMLRDALASSGLTRLIELVISVQPLGLYKPAPPTYGLAAEALGMDAGRLVFVSANSWDAAGAASAGLRAILVNPAGAPAERLPSGPAATIGSLAELPAALGAA